MAKVEIDLTSDAVKACNEIPNHVQYIPCNISHNGEINLTAYFQPYIKKHADGDKIELSATFRGYPFAGEEMKVPEGFTGLVLHETKAVAAPDAAGEQTEVCSDGASSTPVSTKTLRGICRFNHFTYWNLDCKPSYADKYQQALNWLDVSSVIHGSD